MLSKNSTLGVFAVLLVSHAAVIFSQDEADTTATRARRVVAVEETVKAQIMKKQVTEDEDEQGEKEVVAEESAE